MVTNQFEYRKALLEQVRLRDLEIDEATKAIAGLLLEAFPVGTPVVYWQGRLHTRVADVIDHASDGRIKVRGKTGKEYWLHYYRLLPVKD